MFCLLLPQLIISDVSQNTLHRATESRQELVALRFFPVQKSKSCCLLLKCNISSELHSGPLMLLSVEKLLCLSPPPIWLLNIVPKWSVWKESLILTDCHQNCHQMLTATFRDIYYSYIWKNTIKFYCGSAGNIMPHRLCLASCPDKKKTTNATRITK